MARLRLLPESYLYGLVDVRLTANYYTSYLLGKVYAHGVWFYFPVAFLIKSTLGVLALCLLTLGVIATRRLNRVREILFLLVPPIFYLIVALTVGMNIGVRHILVVYAFLCVLIGDAALRYIALLHIYRRARRRGTQRNAEQISKVGTTWLSNHFTGMPKSV
jgi:hypothetical protein